MPIIDLRPVVAVAREIPKGVAKAVADSIAEILGAEPGRVWVRLHELPAEQYAENGSPVGADELPVFVQVLHADMQDRQNRAREAQLIAGAVAHCFGRPPSRVHVEYAPPGRGRIAFGGRLLE